MGRKEEDIFIRFKIKLVVKEEVKAIDTITSRLRLGHLNYSQNEQTRVWDTQSMWISRNCRACINKLHCLLKRKEMSGGRVKRNGDRKYYNKKTAE